MICRAAFDGFALGRTGSRADMGFCLLLLWLLREVLIGDIGDITAFDVAIEGGGGNGPFTGPAKGADNGIRRAAKGDLFGNVICILIMAAQLHGWALCCFLKISVILSNLSRITDGTLSGLGSHMRI